MHNYQFAWPWWKQKQTHSLSIIHAECTCRIKRLKGSCFSNNNRCIVTNDILIKMCMTILTLVSFSKSNIRNITSDANCFTEHIPRNMCVFPQKSVTFLRRRSISKEKFLRVSAEKGWPISICHMIWYDRNRKRLLTCTHIYKHKHDPITVYFDFRIILRETCWEDFMIFECSKIMKVSSVTKSWNFLFMLQYMHYECFRQFIQRSSQSRLSMRLKDYDRGPSLLPILTSCQKRGKIDWELKWFAYSLK